MVENTKREISGKRGLAVAIFVFFFFTALAVAYFEYRHHLSVFFTIIKSEESHPAFLLVSFILLPIVGFPVSPFLVLLGLRFGSVSGIAFMFGIMPVHLAISYWVTRSFLRKRIEYLALFVSRKWIRRKYKHTMKSALQK